MKNLGLSIARLNPALVDGLWMRIYPHIRRDEYHRGDQYQGDHQAVFEEIYERNLWHSDESRSGDGSALAQTAAVRARLPEIMSMIGGNRLFDAPCGDFNWMQHVDFGPDIDYVGADVARPLIEAVSERFSGPRTRFEIRDIIADGPIACDLWLCRDVLFHLPNAAICSLLDKLDGNEVGFLLTTTYPWVQENRDICAGGFRFINLEKPPFSLPPPQMTINDFAFPEPPRMLGLWRTEDIMRARKRLRT